MHAAPLPHGRPPVVPTRELVGYIGGGAREILSSEGHPWTGLAIRRIAAPQTYDNPSIPGVPDLILYSTNNCRGRRRLSGERWEQGSWSRGGWGIIPPERGLSFQYRSTDPIPAYRETTHIYLDPSILEGTAEEAADIDPATVELIPRLAAVDPLLDQLAMALSSEVELHPKDNALFIETTAQLLAIHLLRYHCSRTVDVPKFRGGLPSVKLRRIRELIMARLHAPPSLAELSDEAGTSQYHFSRQFKVSTGMSPHQYVLKQRLDKARELLSGTDLPITEVAARTGFTTSTYFATFFRRTFGETPSSYRRRTGL